MNHCKVLLKRYNKLQLIYKNLLNKYNSFSNKGLCREDATVGINISNKIIIKLNKNEQYYDKFKTNIKLHIDIIIRKNKYIIDAISRSK
tara:strand:- start:245 stop:511 length:267 start_codon:yes stop_codon:yes gene_type:complete